MSPIRRCSGASRISFACNASSSLLPAATVAKSREFRVRKDRNEVRLAIVREMTNILQMEERVDRAARQKIRTQKRDIAEGGEEYELLRKRYYAEEMKKLGINLGG